MYNILENIRAIKIILKIFKVLEHSGKFYKTLELCRIFWKLFDHFRNYWNVLEKFRETSKTCWNVKKNFSNILKLSRICHTYNTATFLKILNIFVIFPNFPDCLGKVSNTLKMSLECSRKFVNILELLRNLWKYLKHLE